jgi:hypothetical protein
MVSKGSKGGSTVKASPVKTIPQQTSNPTGRPSKGKAK